MNMCVLRFRSGLSIVFPLLTENSSVDTRESDYKLGIFHISKENPFIRQTLTYNFFSTYLVFSCIVLMFG